MERLAQQSGAILVRTAEHYDFDEEDLAHMNASGGRKLFSGIAESFGESCAKALMNYLV